LSRRACGRKRTDEECRWDAALLYRLPPADKLRWL